MAVCAFLEFRWRFDPEEPWSLSSVINSLSGHLFSACRVYTMDSLYLSASSVLVIYLPKLRQYAGLSSSEGSCNNWWYSAQSVEDLSSSHRIVSAPMFFQNVIELLELSRGSCFAFKEIPQIAVIVHYGRVSRFWLSIICHPFGDYHIGISCRFVGKVGLPIRQSLRLFISLCLRLLRVFIPSRQIVAHHPFVDRRFAHRILLAVDNGIHRGRKNIRKFIRILVSPLIQKNNPTRKKEEKPKPLKDVFLWK